MTKGSGPNFCWYISVSYQVKYIRQYGHRYDLYKIKMSHMYTDIIYSEDAIIICSYYLKIIKNFHASKAKCIYIL